MNDLIKKVLLIALSLIIAAPAIAHYGMVIPSDSMIMQGENRKLELKLSFSHPFESVGMELVKPDTFGVFFNGTGKNLVSTLRPAKVMDNEAWQTDYRITRPGVYIFYMVPKPYWEPAEDCFIIHYTKTIVAAFGDDEGWDQEIGPENGLKTEIVPLSKPFGLYTGNLFQGIVKLNGIHMPYSKVEVEYYNKGGKDCAPTDYMITQTIKADGNGVFTYSVPKSGWWGFAALNTADYRISYKNQEKDVELGAVMWIKFHDWKAQKK